VVGSPSAGVGFLIIFPALAKAGLARLLATQGAGSVFFLWGWMSTMDNITYRSPTEAETEAYKAAVDEVVSTTRDPAEAARLARTAIERVLGPCVYERLDAGKTQVTQSTPDADGVHVQFSFNADL
jgi:hypothetical protein